MCTFRLRSLSCFLIISAEIWSLNGKATRYFKRANAVLKRSLASEKLNVSKMKINDVLDLKHSSQ